MPCTLQPGSPSVTERSEAGIEFAVKDLFFSVANSDYIVFVMENQAFNYLYSTIREAKMILV